MSRTDPSAAYGQIPYEPGRCRCGHLEPIHALTDRGKRGGCSASTCACRRYEETPDA